MFLYSWSVFITTFNIIYNYNKFYNLFRWQIVISTIPLLHEIITNITFITQITIYHLISVVKKKKVKFVMSLYLL